MPSKLRSQPQLAANAQPVCEASVVNSTCQTQLCAEEELLSLEKPQLGAAVHVL
jgi:hypothetical protein